MYEYFNNYAITKCLLSCGVLLMLIGSRQYTVLFSLKYWIELNWIESDDQQFHNISNGEYTPIVDS